MIMYLYYLYNTFFMVLLVADTSPPLFGINRKWTSCWRGSVPSSTPC